MAKNTLKYRDTLYAKLGSGSLHLAMSFLPDSLEPNTLSAEVETESRALLDFNLDDPVTVYHREEQMGIFYLQSVTQTAPNKYALYATSAVGLLIRRLHRGGLYTGQTVAEVLPEIFGPIPYSIKSSLEGIKLYGWLPYVKPPDASARDNLCKILFNIGAIVKTDLDGVIRIEPLWDGIASSLPRGRMGLAASAVRDGKVTAVSVTEHQYVAGTDEEDLFEGTTQSGDEISFDEPMHSLVATGFTILERGANYAVLSAGSGTLTGKTYVHNTRVVTKTVNQSQTENVQDYSDQTLVSLVSSSAVAERLAAYYKCFESIDAPVVYRGEAPGDRILTYHPYDMVSVPACLESADINLSNTLKADESLLVGYVPPDPERGYITRRVVLTGTGQWQRPAGVRDITYVLISGAQGGTCGSPGEAGKATTISFSYSVLDIPISARGQYPGEGGAGGAGGAAGAGGKIYRGEMDVSSLETLSYSCGVGGQGSSSPSTPGAMGGATTLGGVSSDLGSSSDTGYTDVITGEVYAAAGKPGISGGNGAGSTASDRAETGSDGLRYTPATGVTDEDGRYWAGGTTKSLGTNNLDNEGDSANFTGNLQYGYAGALASYALGSGAAAGQAGTSPTNRGSYSVSRNSSKTVITARATSAAGYAGANATLVPKKATNGNGGRGGYGGGGGSSIGAAIAWSGSEYTPAGSFNLNTTTNTPGAGGSGSRGGQGSDGLIIIYYSEPEPDTSGQLKDKAGLSVLDRLGRRIIV